MSAATRAGMLLLDVLAGRSAAPGPLPTIEELVERATSGEAVAADALALAHRATVSARAAAAMAADDVSVRLADGSSLPRPQAERQLALKEERRVYPPLRLPLERAIAGTLRPLDALRAFTQALPVDPGIVVADPARERLRAFVDGTAGAAAAARDHLERAGHASVHHEAALRRALDLPQPVLFAAEGVLAAARIASSSMPTVRMLARTAAPRALAGHVVDDGTTLRLFVAPSLSAATHLALATGAGAVVAAAVGAPLHAAGLGLALVDAATRRALGQERNDAAGAFRITAATALLWARARAAVAVARDRPWVGPDAVDELREATRAACRAALQGDPGAAFVEALLTPPWPDGQTLRVPAVAAVDEAIAAAEAARSWLALRDAWDEGFVARGDGLRGLAEHPGIATIEGNPGTHDARAWDVLLGELL